MDKINNNKIILKTNLLKNNYKYFIKKHQNYQYSLQNFQRKRQDYFFFKKSVKNILQFLFKKGEKKKVYNLLKKIFILKNNNKFIENKNYNLFKSFYKILFSNTPYMNFLDLPFKSNKRFKSRRNKKTKNLFLVPILPRVQKRIQANWFLNSILKENKKSNLTQKFLNELSKSFKSKEWMLKESIDFYAKAMQSFLRFGRKSIKIYKKKKKNLNFNTNKNRKVNFIKSKSTILINFQKAMKKKLIIVQKQRFNIFKKDFIELMKLSNNKILVKNNNLKLKKKRYKKKKLSSKKKDFLEYYTNLLKNQNINKFNKNINLELTLEKKDSIKKNYRKNLYLQSFHKHFYNLKNLNYNKKNLLLNLFPNEIKFNFLTNYILTFDKYCSLLKNDNKYLTFNEKVLEKPSNLKLNKNIYQKNRTKKIIYKSLKWFRI